MLKIIYNGVAQINKWKGLIYMIFDLIYLVFHFLALYKFVFLVQRFSVKDAFIYTNVDFFYLDSQYISQFVLFYSWFLVIISITGQIVFPSYA